MKNNMQAKRRSVSIWHILLLTTISAGLNACLWSFSIRFSNQHFNYISMILAFLIPPFCLLLLIWLKQKALQIVGIVIFIPISLVSILLLLMTLMVYLLEVGNFKYARHIDLGEQQVSMYLHGGGVITANSIIVKKEKLIVPGILYTEHVYKEDRTDDIDIEKLKEICWAIDDQALTEQEFIEAFKADTEKDDAFQWLAIAAYEESLGYYQDALTSVDIAIDDGNWWPPYEYKAKYIARNEGYDKAVAWFNELITESPNEQKFHYLLGEFYQEQGKRPEAIAAYEKNISMLSDMYEFRFDDNHHLIIDANTNSKHHNDFGDLSWGLEKLASSCYREKDFVKAWQYATMGVSIGRQMLQRKDYMNYTQETVDAGDAYCRIIRAYVYMQQKQWDLAQKEIGKAELLTSKHNSFAWDTLEKAKRDYKNLKSIKYLSKELRRELKVS